MIAYLHRTYRFSASHRLHCDAYDEARNRAMYGKCNNPHGHGHNYVLEVTVSGTPDPVTGMLVDLVKLDRLVQEEVVSRYDLENLNLLPEFVHTVPTTENLTVEVHKRLASAIPGACLRGITIEETSNNTFAYGDTQRT